VFAHRIAARYPRDTGFRCLAIRARSAPAAPPILRSAIAITPRSARVDPLTPPIRHQPPSTARGTATHSSHCCATPSPGVWLCSYDRSTAPGSQRVGHRDSVIECTPNAFGGTTGVMLCAAAWTGCVSARTALLSWPSFKRARGRARCSWRLSAALVAPPIIGRGFFMSP
jgi:hypothetical protein